VSNLLTKTKALRKRATSPFLPGLPSSLSVTIIALNTGADDRATISLLLRRLRPALIIAFVVAILFPSFYLFLPSPLLETLSHLEQLPTLKFSFINMNENLIERFSRNRRADAPNRDQSSLLREKLNIKVQQYYEPSQKPLGAGQWLDCPEMPTSAEVMDMDGDSLSSDIIEIAPNIVEGPWESKGEFLPTKPQSFLHALTLPSRGVLVRSL
jgi:hypothetical protein